MIVTEVAMFNIRTMLSATLILEAVLLVAVPGRGLQDQGKDSMAGMDMSGGKGKMGDMADMKDMGPSMAAMAGHMAVTPVWPKQPGDEAKAEDVVAQAKAAMERYKDYRKALADGYVIANPKLEQPQYHFNNEENVKLAETKFDPTRPSSLLYRRTPTQRYKLEGVMFTDRVGASEDELNERIPLSVVRWHQHTNFCAAPADKVKDYHADKPKFGMFGSIHTKEACVAEGGTFFPVMFNWMIHVFPYEEKLKDVFSMNDDVAHVH